MTNNEIALISSLVAGLSTGVGALPIFFRKKYSQNFINFALGASAGIMLVASFISLILPGFEYARELLPNYKHTYLMVLVGLIVGYLAIIFIHNHLPHEHLFKEKDMKENTSLSRVMLIVMAITLHNLPEGLAVGVGFGGTDLDHALEIAFAISLQNMPEGLVVAFGLLSEGSSRSRAVGMAFLSGAVEPVAALFGFLATRIVVWSLPVALGFAAGAMLFVVCQEMLPELFRQGREKSATRGVILGIVIMLILGEAF